MDKIAAGIVVYNPDNLKRFKKALTSITSQFEKVYIFDNSTKKTIIPDKFNNIAYMSKHKNLGIAYALNRIMEKAEKDGYEWVVTMDQDSILPQGTLKKYEKYTNIKNVGVISPQPIDKRRAYEVLKTSPKFEYIDKCITSGSCTSIDAWKKVGKFDEWLFIDLIDNDFSKRLRIANYKILQMNNVILDQEYGEIKPKSENSQLFWLRVSKILNNVNFAKLGYKKRVNPLRIYYTNRNIIYLNKKLKKYNGIGYVSYNTSNYFGFWISFNLPSILRAQWGSKLKVIKAINSGIKDGRARTVKEWKP